MLLANKVAIVTGGAQGIGRATVERLAREGAKLVVADVNDDEGNKVVAAVKASGNEAVYRSADISERLDVYNLVAAARDAFGKVDILVNNAGTVDDQPFLELEEAEFDRVMRTNVKGAFLISQAVAKQMVRQRTADAKCPPGAIVSVTSVNARFGQADHLAYAVSKGGLEQLTRCMALALAPYGIRVNAVGPGTVETEMVRFIKMTTRASLPCRGRRWAVSARPPKSLPSSPGLRARKPAISPVRRSGPMAGVCRSTR
jgi:glucose 1-dehydrogenase